MCFQIIGETCPDQDIAPVTPGKQNRFEQFILISLADLEHGKPYAFQTLGCRRFVEWEIVTTFIHQQLLDV